MIRPPPISTLFPHPTLFRSHLGEAKTGRHPRLVVEARSFPLAADAADLLDTRRPLDERQIGARLEVGAGASDRLVERAAVPAARIRAGDEDEVRVELAPDGPSRAVRAHPLPERADTAAGGAAATA